MRSYGDACGITRALDILGERWAIPVVRELIFGPRRYSDLAAALPGVSTNILGSRLKGLTEAGIVAKRRLPPPLAVTVYQLTPWGAELEPILIALGRWGAQTPLALEHQTFGASSLALSLKTTFDPAAASGLDLGIQLVMSEDVFDARVIGGRFVIHRAAGPIPDHPVAPPANEPPSDGQVSIEADPKTLAAIVYQRLDLDDPIARGAARIDGSPALVEAFAASFTLPTPTTKERS